MVQDLTVAFSNILFSPVGISPFHFKVVRTNLNHIHCKVVHVEHLVDRFFFENENDYVTSIKIEICW